jgi:hypothetical protein
MEIIQREQPRLQRLQVNAAFALKVRDGQIESADFTAYRKRLLADVRERLLNVVHVRGAQFKEADRLLQEHGCSVKLRTLDALQLATTPDLQARGMLNHFVCTYLNLCAIAAAEGLSVINPETL